MTGCSWLVNSMAFHPESVPETFSAPPDPRIEERFFNSLDGTRLHALFFRRPDSRRIVLFLHGNAGHAFYRVGDALRLLDSGANVLLLSYRGYGKSEGSPSERGVYQDGRAALEHLHDELGYSPRQTFILGRSIGSAVAVDIARDRQLAGLILVTPFSSGRDMAAHLGVGWLSWLIGNPFDSVGKVSGVHVPMLFIHGDADRIIPMELGRRLFDASPTLHKTFHVVHGADHNDLVPIAGSRYWTWIGEFLDASSPGAD